jgi:hypothetical protein
MKTKDKFEESLLKEIREINPRDRAKLFEIIHYLRLGLAVNEIPQTKNIKRFAGMWRDLDEIELEKLLSTYKDRENYFQERQFH